MGMKDFSAEYDKYIHEIMFLDYYDFKDVKIMTYKEFCKNKKVIDNKVVNTNNL